MDAAKKYKGNYCMGFTDKHGKKIQCKISYKTMCIPTKRPCTCCSVWFWKKSNVAGYKFGNTGNIPEEKAVYYCYKSLSYEVEDRRILLF